MERGQGRRSRAFLPLTPWNRPNTHRRGRWIGFATCPCGLASVSGVWGKAPKGLFFVFEVVRVDVTVQKRSKKCAFLESLLLKTPQIWPISDPTPTLTGVSNQKTSVFAASEYTKNNSPKVVLKRHRIGAFFVSKDTKRQKTTKNTLIYRYRKRTIKSQ